MAGLRQLSGHPHVGDVRGKGLMAIVEVVKDKGARQAYTAADGVGLKLQEVTRRSGLIVRCSDGGIAMSPPLIITAQEIDTMVNVVGEAIREVLG